MSWADDASMKELRSSGYFADMDDDDDLKPDEWRTRDGVTLKICDMETSHIRNCINMLKRIIACRPDEYAWGEPDSDTMAYLAFEQGIRENDRTEQGIRKQIRVFEGELERRGEL